MSRFIKGLLACSMIVSSYSVWASPNTCSLSKALHCVSFKGLPSDFEHGYYVREEVNGIMSAIECAAGNYDERVPGDEIPGSADSLYHKGANFFRYSICSDLKGTNCQVVKEDDFSLVQDAEGFYEATPLTAVIDFSPFLNDKKFPGCKMNY
jgi:hypothetical protein